MVYHLELFCQVTIEYKYQEGACVPLRIHTVVISVQHNEEITVEQLRKEIMEKVVLTVLPQKLVDDRTIYHIQPSGKFIIGGPQVSVTEHCHLTCLTICRTLTSKDGSGIN